MVESKLSATAGILSTFRSLILDFDKKNQKKRQFALVSGEVKIYFH